MVRNLVVMIFIDLFGFCLVRLKGVGGGSWELGGFGVLVEVRNFDFYCFEKISFEVVKVRVEKRIS